MKKLLFLLALIPIQVLFAQKEGLTPMDIANLEYVSTAEISIDGSKIAYTVVKQADPTKENSSASLKLWMYDVKSGTSSPFITQGSLGGVAFRPGHNSITFLANREGDSVTSLYEIPITGGEALKIFGHETSISSYEWSPDGKTILFLAKEKMNKKSSLPYEPIIYEENLPLTKAFVTIPGEETDKIVEMEGQCYSIHWSPDGSKISISTAPTALVDDSYMKQRIHILDAKSLSVIGTIDHAAKLGSYAWSPDSKHIAMISGADIYDPIAGRLFVVSADGGKPKSIIPDFKGKFEDISWDDAKTIRFIASEGVYTTIGTISSKGKKLQKTIDKGNTAFSHFTTSEDGTLALIGSSANHPNELFIHDGKSIIKITDSNPWLADKKLGKQEVIVYKAKDGLEIEGLVILPLDYEKNTKYPLITVVHGGPESHFDNGWLTSYSRPGHMGAANGFMIFYPNYRGSTGKGEEFAKSSQGDPAGKEFDDVIDGIDYLIEAGMVDKSKVGVTGGSYGGYATGWMSTRHTEQFAAGVMFVGISDNISKWGTSDIPEEMFLVHSRKRIWDDYEFFLKRSPIYYADQAKTPLLILAGAGDTRVDPGQSKELYRHIKTRTETPVRLVLYPGEGHGNRKSTARFDYNLRMMRWFNLYLKQGGGDIPETELDLEVD
ncbi:MAG: S9 family peptidase [Cyclobacteriaceae bacterium]|nr:S9 family peptidase [Cyclobacteriaceae bacterium]